ncbi:ribosome maturation factor RimP [Porticoccaceae bacterium]|nr:ribosome maturation factor RimP [Porticoccaceae bacterium]
MADRGQTLRELLQPQIEALGAQLWGLDLQSGGRRKLLRIYIDRDEGVDVELCAAVSRQVSAIMDVEDPIQGEYVLEVSSPGMDRPLYELAHYQQLLGEQIAIKLRFAYEGQRNFKGLLQAVEGDDIVLVVADHEYLFPIEGIEKANVVPQF